MFAMFRSRPLYKLALVEPGDDLLDRLGGVFVLDDLASGLRRGSLRGDPLGGRVIATDLRGVDADVRGGDRVERLLLGSHDRLQGWVARLVDRIADGDDG